MENDIMNNEQIIMNMKRVKNNLEEAKKQLNYFSKSLENSITINGVVFKKNIIKNLQENLNVQINNVNIKIINKINSL